MRSFFVWALALGLLISPTFACASGEAGPRGSGTLIEAEAIEGVTSANSAYDVVRTLRPSWLRSRRGQDSFTDPGAGLAMVYVDGRRFGGLNALQDIAPGDVEEIEYLRPQDATLQFGPDHDGGAIMVRTKR